MFPTCTPAKLLLAQARANLGAPCCADCTLPLKLSFGPQQTDLGFDWVHKECMSVEFTESHDSKERAGYRVARSAINLCLGSSTISG